MSIYNNIKDLLGIKDENIKIDEKYYIQKKIKWVDSHVLKGALTYHATKCDKCGSKNNGTIVINGFKECKIRLLKSGGLQTVLYLKKHRFLCRTCNKTFTAKTTLVDGYCNISNAVKQKISTDLLDPLSFTYIGKSNRVSANTVIRVFKKAINHFQPNFDYLPECLCFDDSNQ